MPHQWLAFFVGAALLVLGCILVGYILFLRHKAVRLHKEQSNAGVSPGEASEERRSWWEPQGSPEKASEEQGKGDAPPEPEQRRSWWHRIFLGD